MKNFSRKLDLIPVIYKLAVVPTIRGVREPFLHRGGGMG